MKVTVKVEGLKELDQALGELTKATARNTVRRALVKGAEPLETAAKNYAPTRFWDLWGSIHISTRPPHGGDDGKQAFAQAMRAGASRGEAIAALRSARADAPFTQVWVGAGRNPQAQMQEFGTQRHPPQPFMRPAFDHRKDTALDRITEALKADIGKAVARARRKAARRAG